MDIPNDGRYRVAPNSQKAAAVKERITYESALRAEGIDEVFVARKLMDLLQAQGQRWNPKKGSWEKFEDYGTQLAALREIAKIFGIYGECSEGVRMPTVINLTGIPRHEYPIPRNGDESIATATGDGREHCER
jgi:hypothetical protein